VLTPLQLLLESTQDLPPAQVKEKLSSIQGNIHRLLRMVNQLLDFSAIESGSATVAFEQRDLGALLEPIVRDFEPFARSKGLSLMLRGPDDLPRIYVDPEKLEKVVSNLLSNACKFTDEGGTVVVRLRANDREVSLSVKDSGSGISDEDLPKIFERFRQLDDAASRRYQGSGIGLALAKELVELTGGRIEAESELGYGSTFTVYLPLGTDHIQEPNLIRSLSHEDGETVHAAATASALEAEQGREQMRPEREARKGPMVLVVEDHADMRGLVVEICEQEYQVMEAADGKQGLELIREHRPALVISDVMMPEMDGLELLRRLRSDPVTQSIPVMLLTALAGSEMRLDGLERGADDYLPKPFNSRELLARARNLIRLKQQEQELRELNARLQQELVDHASKLERARMLQRYLPPETVNAVLENGLPVQVGQERCRLTVFRMELRGFEELLEFVQPEDMAAMLNGYLSEMVDVAFEHGATVDNLIRDTVTGFFGAPDSKGNRQDAIRCTRMALQMWQRAVDIRERWREFLNCKPPVPTIVMASGYATVGNFGSSNRLEFTAVGGPVDEANALLPAIGPGEVVCSHSTHTLLHGEIESEFCGETTLGYSSRPAKLYRIAGPPQTGAIDETLEDTDLDSVESGKPVSSPSSVSSDTPRTAPVPGSGDIIAERYKVASQLGKGGMGIVFKVMDQKLNTDVALKLLRHDLDPDRQTLDRLYREVKLARLVSHTNVARIYDVGDWDGHEFITMEYIDGETLGHRLKIKGAQPVAEAQDLLRQVCAGLLAAHTAGIIHRDLKPHNIMLDRSGRAVILDFGIAKWAANLHHTGTETQKMLGTPFYMAPEQFQEGRVDNRTDIYALGVVAFEIVTGQRPFDASSSVALAYKHTEEDPPDPLELRPDLSPRLAAVILRCLEKSPHNRFGSVSEILSLLA
jgi:CheY-like chemotaxis protein/predicted Ser/Thr protein kinase/two-component sensor histidine kinase